ncbi:MAG: folate family ECF transporter S component [Synergistaceae bacterium]|nr:folate family ECF transporter S component [Synergistaceae bacterium]
MKKTYTVVLIGLLVSMEIVFTRFLSIDAPFFRASLGFLPISVAAMIFGPLGGGAVNALSDILGVMIANRSIAPPHPGITLCAFLIGLTYGFFLYKKPKTILRVLLSVLTVNILIEIGLKTYWLSQLYGEAYLIILAPRAAVALIMIPVQTGAIYNVWRYVGSFIESNVLPKLGLVTVPK